MNKFQNVLAVTYILLRMANSAVSNGTLVLRIVVDEFAGSGDVRCSKLDIVVTADTGMESATQAVLVLGLPVGLTRKELDIFVDPFASEVDGVCFLKESKLCEATNGQILIRQLRSAALLFFNNKSSADQFKDLYNNMQLPSYSDTAPCVAAHPLRIEVLLGADCAASSLPSPAVSPLSPKNVPSGVKPSVGSPARAGSPFQATLADAAYAEGLRLLMEHRVAEFPSTPAYVDHSKAGSPVIKYDAEAAAIVTSALPTCTVCLRRVRGLASLTSSLAGANDITVCRSYATDARLTFDELSTAESAASSRQEASRSEGVAEVAVRCLPCHIFHSVVTADAGAQQSALRPQASSSSSNAAALAGSSAKAAGGSGMPAAHRLGRCCTCELSDNIWLCLQCGHTGCGRYTSQHAKAHYQQQPSHNLSLELASGRIWNYHTDTFCYFEDTATESLRPGNPALHRRESSRAFPSIGSAFPLSVPEELPSSMVLEEPGAASQQGRGHEQPSPTACKRFMVPSFAYPSGTSGSSQGHNRGLWSGVYAAQSVGAADELSGLDSVTVDKVNALMNSYEHLLEAQLLDQQLYFEKLLARETVRVLEQSFQQGQEKNPAGGAPAASSKKGKAGKSSALVTDTSAAEEKKDNDTDEGAASAAEAFESDCTLASPFLTRSSAYQLAASALEDADMLRDMQEVEALKLEISSVEAEYRGALEAVKAADDAVRLLKRDNDALIRTQKSLREQEQEKKDKTEQLRLKCAGQIADLEQQVMDLTFYTKTRKQVQESPLRDEIKQGVVVTTQKPPTPQSAGSQSGGKKGSFKKS